MHATSQRNTVLHPVMGSSFRHCFQGAFFLLVLALTGCFGGKAVAPTEPAVPPPPVVLSVHSSTNPEESRDEAFIDGIRETFLLPEGVTELEGSVASYISRFYANTDAFHKALRCDSFILRHNPALAGDALTGNDLKNDWYHVALFTYKDTRYVKQIRNLEKRNTTKLRVHATEDQPGVLTYKASTEGYRIFFGEKRVVVFFYPEKSTPKKGERHEDPVLYEAAQSLKDILLQ